MESNKDAYGQLIWAYFKGNRSSEIVEREDRFFTTSKIGPKGYFSEYNDWPKYQKKAMKFAKGRVLDVGCGAGRHSLYLQKKGFDAIGIDTSPLAIKVCKLRGLRNAERMSIIEVNKFKPNSFDTIIMLGNNFGLFGNFKGAKKILGKFYRITSPGSMIIAESTDPYKTDNSFHLEYQKFNRKRGKMSGQLKIRIIFEKYIGNWFEYLLVSKEEMKEILKGTGWRVKKFVDSSESQYIAIIEKK